MAYTLKTTKKFDRAVQRCIARGYNMLALQTAMQLLTDNGKLPAKYKSHKLKGYKGNKTWECHIEPNWLLVWEQYDTECILIMLSTGTHSDLFKN